MTWPQSVWIRVGAVALAVLALLLIGGYVRGKFEEADQAQLLRQQIKDGIERQRTECRGQGNRGKIADHAQQYAVLNNKWGDIRAKKDRNVCQLDADTVSLLKAASK